MLVAVAVLPLSSPIMAPCCLLLVGEALAALYAIMARTAVTQPGNPQVVLLEALGAPAATLLLLPKEAIVLR